MEEYKTNSLKLPGAIAMDTGVMIGAGIFALTGHVLGAFIVSKARTDMLVVIVSLPAMLTIFIDVQFFLHSKTSENAQ